jgi:hypothetical protein
MDKAASNSAGIQLLLQVIPNDVDDLESNCRLRKKPRK